MHISILNGTDETLYEFNKSYELKGVNTIMHNTGVFDGSFII